MNRVFWDTNPFIYLFEGHGRLSERARDLRRAMLDRGDQLLTSTLTLGEVLVKPIERGDEELSRKYEEAITATSLMLSLDAKAARIYARLRCDRALRAPGAIQLACAAAAGVDLFITNDARLHSKHVEGIQFIVPLPLEGAGFSRKLAGQEGVLAGSDKVALSLNPQAGQTLRSCFRVHSLGSTFPGGINTHATTTPAADKPAQISITSRNPNTNASPTNPLIAPLVLGLTAAGSCRPASSVSFA